MDVYSRLIPLLIGSIGIFFIVVIISYLLYKIRKKISGNIR